MSEEVSKMTGWLDDNDRKMTGWVDDDRKMTGSLNDDRKMTGCLGDDRQMTGCLGDDRKMTGSLNDDRKRTGCLGDDRKMTGCQYADDRRVLCVGKVCLDILKYVEFFPVEDTDRRCLECVWQRGGNAANTSSVLALLGQPAEFLGTVTQSPLELRFLREDFASYGVHVDNLVECPNSDCPLSVVIVNTLNGSRTILHTNTNMREVTMADFRRIPLSENSYKWIHFECRPTIAEITCMLQYLDHHNKISGTSKIILSVEFEKPRNDCDFDVLFPIPDYLFFSKDFALHHGYSSMEQAVTEFAKKAKPGATVICAWGDRGAAAKTPETEVVTSPALDLDLVVDTLAAGDTFIAGTIIALTRGSISIAEAIRYGCKVAGTKCGMRGLRGLSKLHTDHTKS